MSRSNFRVKLDLCNFYKDVRRFCWTFIEGTKMWHIFQLKIHIAKMFNIREPFHLMLNDTEYLPPSEDIRILKEDETIVVCPGSGLEGTIELAANATVSSDCHCSFINTEKTSNFVKKEDLQDKISRTCAHEVSITRNINDTSVQQRQQSTPVEKLQDTVVRTNLWNSSKLLHESIKNSQNDTLESSTNEKTEDEETSVSECKIIDSKLTTEHSATEDSVPRQKRKRIRSRKRNRNQEKKQPVEQESISGKPKIINSYVIPSGKHIHFNTIDDEEDATKESVHKETINGSCTNQATPPELANLLSLRQNPFPPTFEQTIVKEEIKIDNTSGEEIQMNISLDNINVRDALSKKFENGKELLAEELEVFPIMTWKPQLKDVIAFKILKIGEDYTPQVSGFVVGEVISCCEKAQVYTFKVLQGASETQEPVGKFALGTDEDQIRNDTITLDYSQLIEPRPVYKCDPDRVSTPILNG